MTSNCPGLRRNGGILRTHMDSFFEGKSWVRVGLKVNRFHPYCDPVHADMEHEI